MLNLRALVLLAGAAFAALAAPNFSGEWKLNAAKSEFGPMPAPNSLTEKIAHEDPKLKVAIKQSGNRGEFEYEMNYTTDGKECVNQIRNNPMKATLKWDGDALVIDTKGKFGQNDVSILDTWNLSPEGKTLTITRRFKSSQGEATQKLVLEKQ